MMQLNGFRESARLNLIVLAYILAQATAQMSSATFQYPPATMNNSYSLRINVYDTVIIDWASNYDTAWMYLWCDPDAVAWFITPVDPTGTMTWSPMDQDVNGDWTQPKHCWLDLVYRKEDNVGTNGADIDITSYRPSAATTFAGDITTVSTFASSAVQTTPISKISTPDSTSSTPDSKSSTQQSPISTPGASGTITSSKLSVPTSTILSMTLLSSTSSPGPPPATSTAASSTSKALSTGAKAGIALVSLVGSLTFGGLIYLILRNRRKMREIEARLHASVPKHQNVLGELDGASVSEMPVTYQTKFQHPQELQ